MKKNAYIQIDDKLFDEIDSYAKLNELDFYSFVNELLKKGLNIEKYGDTPFTSYNVSPSHIDDKVTINGINYSKDDLANIIGEYYAHSMKLDSKPIVHSTEEKIDISKIEKIAETAPLEAVEKKPEVKKATKRKLK